MQEIGLNDPRAIGLACDALRSDAVMVEMPTVFVLLAPATTEGAGWLDRTKTRQSGKNYGTAIGDAEAFRWLARPGALPTGLDGPGGLDVLTGAFVRFEVADPSVDTVMVRGGTHQGLLIDGPHRELFAAIEAATAPWAEPGLMGGHRYTSPLCTSANHSGHPDGSIVTWERAREFGRETGVPLVLRYEAPEPAGEGSYPIFWFHDDGYSVEREGPGQAEIAAALDRRLLLTAA